MTDWDPTDPDATLVYYDLSAWSIDQQAELASELADAELSHAWEGTELMVPEEAEQAADLLIADVEARLGIVDDAPPFSSDESDEALQPIELAAGAPTTEYDLGEWASGEREAVGHALMGARIPFRWEDDVLLVGTDDEGMVDSLLDDIETGEFVDVATGADIGEQPPPEILTTFFVAGERLRRNPLDADGLERLLAATEVAEPAIVPYGVQPKLWEQTCALADRLADALVADDEVDHEDAMAAANELHDLLRPYV